MALKQDPITGPLIEESTQGINKIINNDIQLRNAAQTFLNNINKIVRIYEDMEQHDLKLFKSGKMSLSKFYTKISNTDKTLQQVIKQQYIFEEALNKFLDRKIILLFVDKNGNLLYGDESIIYKYISTEHKATGRGKISNSIKKELESFPVEVSKTFKDIYKIRLQSHRPIYDEARRRLNINKQGGESKKIYGYLKAHNLLSTFWWEKDVNAIELNQRYGWSRTTNNGHLGEAYASLIWENEHQKMFNPDNEQDIENFYNYMVDHGIYDIIAGIVKGDVSFLTDNFANTAIQFAVKTTGSQTGRIGSYLIMASLLTSSQFIITPETVSHVLNNLSSYTTTITKVGLEATADKINEELKKLKLI